MAYPNIVLDESNKEIEDCAVIHALIGLYISIQLRDGHSWDYVSVDNYEDGLLFFTVNDGIVGQFPYQVMVPLESIETIRYI